MNNPADGNGAPEPGSHEYLTMAEAAAVLRLHPRTVREYVRRGYRWDVVLGKYERLFAKIRNAR